MISETPTMINNQRTIALVRFFDKASSLQHDTQRLANGEEVESYLTMHSLAEALALVSNATPEQKAKRLESFFNPVLQARAKLGQGIHDRAEAMVFAGAKETAEDYHWLKSFFPLYAKSVSLLHKTVRSGEVWDLSARAGYWGVSDTQDVSCIVNIGTLVLEKNASVVIQGNILSLLCGQIICDEPDDPGLYHIGILPTPFSADHGDGPLDGIQGKNGKAGFNGIDGDTVHVRYDILGPWIDESKEYNTSATAGVNGEHGEDGRKGRNGGMCKLAEISIGTIKGNLGIFAQAGRGGNGGNGGAGGNGGNGGNGGHAAKGFNETVPAGKAGSAGNGGSGGKGGHAGHGGLSSNIYINLPNDNAGQISLVALPAEGGIAGKGGAAGTKGQRGRGGNSIDRSVSATECEAMNGSNGKDGLSGRERPAATYYVNDIIFNQ